MKSLPFNPCPVLLLQEATYQGSQPYPIFCHIRFLQPHQCNPCIRCILPFLRPREVYNTFAWPQVGKSVISQPNNKNSTIQTIKIMEESQTSKLNIIHVFNELQLFNISKLKVRHILATITLALPSAKVFPANPCPHPLTYKQIQSSLWSQFPSGVCSTLVNTIMQAETGVVVLRAAEMKEGDQFIDQSWHKEAIFSPGLKAESCWPLLKVTH